MNLPSAIVGKENEWPRRPYVVRAGAKSHPVLAEKMVTEQTIKLQSGSQQGWTCGVDCYRRDPYQPVGPVRRGGGEASKQK